MSARRLYLDEGFGESRGVVTLDGRPERLLIQRDGDNLSQTLGARLVARVRRTERAQALAFLDLGGGPDGILNITRESGPLAEGAVVEVEIKAESRGDKGAALRLIGPAEGVPRLLQPPPTLEQRLRAFDHQAEFLTGRPARGVADVAQEEVVQTRFRTPGGGDLAVEQTRALISIDVDLGNRPGGNDKRAARAANLSALAVAARVLRLKGLGGLVVIDFVGKGHDGPVLLSAARAAFGPDNPGVAFGPISRFGTLELTIPRRSRPALDILAADGGVPTALTQALMLIRALEREAAVDGGGRFEGIAPPEVVEAAGPALALLNARSGGRLTLRPDTSLGRLQQEVIRL